MTAMVRTLAEGVAIGFAIAAPVGPMGMLCIRRTLSFGPAIGLASGLGTACADGVYGIVAAAGLGALASALVAHDMALRLAGGSVVVWLGLMTLRRAWLRQQFAAIPNATRRSGVFASFGSSFLLTLANPTTILGFAGVIAGLSGRRGVALSAADAYALVAGIFAGSAAWWLILVSGVGLARAALPATALRWIETASGAVLLAFGLVAISSALPA